MAYKLSEIVKTGINQDPPKIGIYGPPAIGKTTFVSSAKDCIGILTEDGVGNLDFPRIYCSEWQSVKDALQSLLTEEHTYKTVFIDSLSFTEPLIYRHVCKEHGKENIEDFGYGKGYQVALNEWHWLLNKLNEIRAKKRMVVVLVGHSAIKTFNPPDGESYDRYVLELYKDAASLIIKWLDVLLFATKTTFTKKSEDGKRTLATSESERVLYTEERPAFQAKNHYSLPPDMPMSWTGLIQNIKQGVKKNGKEG